MSILLRAALAVLLAAALAACGEVTGTGDPEVAATVNGTDITIAQVEEQFETAKQQPQVSQQLEQDPDGKFRKEVQATVLTRLVTSQLLEQWAEELKVSATPEEVTSERAALVEEFGGQEAFDQQIEQSGLTEPEIEEEIRKIVLQNEISDRVAADVEVTDEEIAAFYEQNAATRFGAKAKARHILVKSEADATRILSQLDKGADFAKIAQEESIDPGSGQNGGDLGEFGPGQMVPAFEEAVFTAQEGDVVGPVKTEFGFHVIEVQELNEAPELADVREEISDEIAETRQGELLQERLQQRTKDATVTVNPRFGVWNPVTATVDPEPPLGEASENVDPSASPGAGLPGEGATAPVVVPTEAATQ